MAITNKRSIKDFESALQASNPLDLMLPQEILTDDDYKLIQSLCDTVAKYKAKDWLTTMSVTEMHTDLMYLQAGLVDMQYKFGVLTSYTESLKDNLKIARSKIRVNAKSLKQSFEESGDSVSITAEDVECLSYVKTEDIWKKSENHRIASDFVKFIYFSIKDHVNMLDHTIQRISRYES